MAYPYTLYANFATGGRDTFDAETDTGSILDFPHYTELARAGQAPYRGAYCMRLKAAGATDAYIQENTSLDIASAGTLWLRWYFYLGKDFAMAANDKFAMLELESVANTTTEVSVGIRRNGSNLELWWNETLAAANPGTFVLGTTTTALNRWRCVEVKVVLDNAANNDGTIDVYVDDGAAGSQIASLDQGAVVDGKLGAIGLDAGTSGTILFADFIADDAQIFADGKRFRPINQWLIGASNHPLIGPGKFSIDFTDSSADGTCTIYDQDGVSTRLEPVTTLRNATAKDFIPGHTSFEVSFGAYVVLTGAAPQAHVQIERGGVLSDAAYVNRGLVNGRPSPLATG